MLNMFDYAGEVAANRELSDFQRMRALNGDGFIFVLDPTQDKGKQSEVLVSIREDLKLIKSVEAGQSVRIPIAICVTKLDLLVTLPAAGPSDVHTAIDRFYEQLRDVDPTGKALNLSIIEQRSKLIADLRDTIWQEWNIENQVNDLFGGRIMFFPMSPYGLNDLGVVDVRDKAQIVPFGILEPFLWLLHMNGYPVLN